MCFPSNKAANIVTKPTDAPEQAPAPVKVAPEKDTARSGRNSLRIDLATGGPRSGVNV